MTSVNVTRTGRYQVDGRKIRGLRTKRFLSLREAGKLAGISEYTWNQLELGHRDAIARSVFRIAEVLKVDPSEIVLEEEDDV